MLIIIHPVRGNAVYANIAHFIRVITFTDLPHKLASKEKTITIKQHYYK